MIEKTQAALFGTIWGVVVSSMLAWSSIVSADQMEIRPGLWKEVEQRDLMGSTDVDPVVAAARSAARAAVRMRLCVGDPSAQERPAMLDAMLAGGLRPSAVRSAKDGPRSSRESVFVMSPRVSMSAPWFEMTLDRGIVSSDRIVTTLLDPDRHQHEHWHWQRSIRSGMLEDDIQSLHELSVWERQGPCPPGMPIGPIFDEETQRMIREMVQRRNAGEAASAPPSKAPKP